MTVGDKIKDLRKKKGYSQEQLAQELFVSRAAVAKWEAGNGIPDIENLKKLSGIFAISIDELLDNHLPCKDEGLCGKSSDIISEDSTLKVDATRDYYHQFVGRKCDIDLKDWNEGEYEIVIVGYDERFVYYLKEEGKPGKGKLGSKNSKDGYERIIGALNKSYIDSVYLLENGYEKDNDLTLEMTCTGKVSKEFFAGKTGDVYLEDKYIWSGILTKSTELFDIGIKSLEGDELVLVTGRIIEVKSISKIEVKLSSCNR